MHDRHDGGGPGLGLLLLIPVAVIIAKGAHRHGAMEAEFGPGPGGAGHPGPIGAARRHGHHSPLWGGAEGDGAETFPLPPRIERILEAWHTRAHQAPEAPEAAEPATS
jgi:hypothetical protein